MDFDFVQFKLPGRWGSLFCVIRPGKQRDVVAQAVRPVGWLPKDFIANHSLVQYFPGRACSYGEV